MPALPTIACVISNWNYERYVGTTIESVLNQTVAFKQVIVVNDGSTDGSLDIIRRYEGQITIIDGPNMGQTGACLRGFQEVTADYVYFLDADDFAAPALVETIQHHLSARPVKVQFQLTTIDEAGTSLKTSYPTYAIGYGAADMIFDNRVLGFYRSPPTSGNIIRSDVLRSLDVSKVDPRAAVDGGLNLVLPYLGAVISLNIPLAFRRIHPNSYGQWSAPNISLLEKEIAVFERNRREAVALLNDEDLWPSDDPPPVYLLERRLMIEALEGRLLLIGPALKFILGQAKSRQPMKQNLLLAAWAASLLWPNRKFREKMIRARRSPVNRSARFDRLIRLTIGSSKAA